VKICALWGPNFLFFVGALGPGYLRGGGEGEDRSFTSFLPFFFVLKLFFGRWEEHGTFFLGGGG
jgi:hypothetical protein